MKYLKIAILGFVIILSGIVIYSANILGWSNIFTFPIITIACYTIFYLHAQFEKENRQRLEQAVKYAVEDNEAEKWIKDSLVPQTISYSKHKRWTIIIYCFLFLAGIFFLWQFINSGLSTAIRDLIIVCALFWLFIYYIYKFPALSQWFSLFLPLRLKNYHFGDWGRAYFFLLPVAFLIYLLYPLEEIFKSLQGKLLSLPLFFLGYTFSFLSLYSIMYIYKEMQSVDKI